MVNVQVAGKRLEGQAACACDEQSWLYLKDALLCRLCSGGGSFVSPDENDAQTETEKFPDEARVNRLRTGPAIRE